MPRRETSRASTLFSTLRVMVCALIKFIAEVFTRESAKAPLKATETSLCLIVLSPDGNSDNDFSLDSPPFKLCHGARHRLEVKAPDGSTWLEQKLSLRWMGADGTAPSLYGLSAEPAFVTDTVDEEASYHVLSATGAEWALTSTPGDAVLSGDVTLGLGSYWQAPMYPISAHVGDHWYGIVTDLDWDGTVPIAEGGKPTTLTATVKSVFDVERPIQGARVTWTVAEQVPRVIETDVEGKSKFEYTPSKDDIVEDHITIKATCEDALGHNTWRDRSLRAYVEAPWHEQLKVVLREKDGEVIEFTSQGMRLVRGGDYQLMLTPDGDFFLGDSLSLDWLDGSGELGIEFSPTGPREMPPEGLTWDITGGDKSGLFNLYVRSLQLGESLLFKQPGVQMSANLAEEAEMTPKESVGGLPPIFHRGDEIEVRIVPKADSPLGLMELAATLYFEQIEEQFSQGQMPSTPTYGTKREGVTNAGVAWCLKAADSGNSGQFGLTIKMPGFTNGLMLPKALALSRELGNEAQVFINDDEEPFGAKALVLRRGKPLCIKLVPREHSGLGRTPLKGWITFDGGTLDEEQVPANPGYGENHKQDMTEQGLSWTLRGADVSGSFTLRICMDGFSNEIVLSEAILLSLDLTDELDLAVGWNNKGVFWGGQTRLASMLAKASSPLWGHDKITAWVEFVELSHLKESDVVMEPDYGVEHFVLPGVFSWEINGQSDAKGVFGLTFNFGDSTPPLDVGKAALIPNSFAQEVPLHPNPIDASSGFAVVGLDVSPSSPLFELDLTVTLSVHRLGEGVKIDCNPPFGEPVPIRRSTTWMITKTQACAGEFVLLVECDGSADKYFVYGKV